MKNYGHDKITNQFPNYLTTSTVILGQPTFPRLAKKSSAFHGSRIDHELAPVPSLRERDQSSPGPPILYLEDPF